MVALVTVQLSDAEVSSELLLDPDEVADTDKELVDSDAVSDVVDLGLITPAEDTETETQSLL